MHNGGNDNEATVIGNGAANQTSNNGQSDKKGKNKSTNWFLIACIVAIIGGMVFFMANNRNKTNSAASIASADSGTIVADTVAVEEDTNVGTTLYTKSVKATESENVILTIEYPTEGSDILLQNIREWINESLGGKYNGDLADGQALFNHYWNEFMKDKVGEDGYGVYNHATIKKVYEDSKVVTFTNETYTYGDGAAHGMESTKGVTFRKSDGRKFTADLLDGSYKYQTEIKNGLRKYFEINTNDELMERLMLRVDFNVPLDENGNVTDETRIKGALPTLKKILNDGGAVIMMSHMGKPKGKVNPKLSLSQIVKNVSSTS